MHPATPPDHRFRDRHSWPDDDLPNWRARPAPAARSRGVVHLLLAMVIAAALAWIMIDAASAAFPYSPCSFRASTQYTSVRPIQRFRQRIIPGQPASPSCPSQPVDPFHQNFAVTSGGQGAR